MIEEATKMADGATRRIDGATKNIDRTTVRIDQTAERIDETTERIDHTTRKIDRDTQSIIVSQSIKHWGNLILKFSLESRRTGVAPQAGTCGGRRISIWSSRNVPPRNPRIRPRWDNALGRRFGRKIPLLAERAGRDRKVNHCPDFL